MGYDLHYVNRGRKYWNNEVKSIPNLNYTYGNREEKQDFSRVLLYLSKKLGISAESSEKWEIVVDFSAFTYKHIRVLIKIIENFLIFPRFSLKFP